MARASTISFLCAALLLTGGCDVLGPKGDTEIRAFTEQETRVRPLETILMLKGEEISVFWWQAIVHDGQLVPGPMHEIRIQL